MISVEDAIESVLHNCQTPKQYRISLNNALGFFLAKDIISPINMPPFRQSAMDGYALNLNEAKTYNLTNEVKAGDAHQPKLNPGEAIRIFTGAAVPDTANAVIMQERVTTNNNKITIEGIVNVNDNIRPLGEQVKQGNIALKKGTKLTPAAIGFLTSLGITEADVYKKPTIAIVVTGNELIEAGQPLTHGKIYESNATMLLTALNSIGYNDASIFKIEDNYQSTFALLKGIISKHDMVLVSGGISVGDYDFVGKALNELQVEQLFYKVKQKPGKPLFFGKKDETSIFALPGNPAAALSCFYVYVHLALQTLSGSLDATFKTVKLKSASNYIKKGDRAQFLKAIIKNNEVTILEGQSSAMLQTFALANALVYVSEEIESIAIGDIIEVIQIPN